MKILLATVLTALVVLAAACAQSTERPSWTDGIASAQDSVVHVKGELQGTGIYVDTQGTVLTVQHLVEEGTEIVVVSPDGQTRTHYEISCTPPHQEVVYLEPLRGELTTKPLRSAPSYEVGEPVLLLGYPDFKDSNPFVASDGIVAGGGHLPPLFELRGVASSTDYIVSNVEAYPGHSGGPLLNARGEVLGIFQGWRSRATTTSLDGFEYAVPIGVFVFATDVSGDDLQC